MRWNGGTLLAAAGWFPFILLPFPVQLTAHKHACVCMLLACLLVYCSTCSYALSWVSLTGWVFPFTWLLIFDTQHGPSFQFANDA